MTEGMSKSDAAIISRGRTGFELALMGVPSISIAQNERETTHAFMKEENGFNYLGLEPSFNEMKKAIKELVESDKAQREILQKKMLFHDLRNGRDRIMHLIRSL